MKGFYIDIGALHPTFDSVTKAFYDRGWSGINVEPIRDFYNVFEQERNRDLNLNIAVSNSSGELEFFQVVGQPGNSTLNKEIAYQVAQEKGLEVSQYKVSVKTLKEICQEYVNQKIDFLKIDVEGLEEEVILGGDWENFRPTVLVIETTLPNTNIRCENNIPNILKKKGYQHVFFDGINDYYIAEESQELAKHFAYPVNVLDFYVDYRILEQNRQIQYLSKLLKDNNISIPSLNVQNNSHEIINTPEVRSPIIVIDGVFFQLFKTGIARVWKSLLEQWANTDFANHILVLDRSNTAPKINGIRYRTIQPYDYKNTEMDKRMLQQICDEEEAELFISSYYTTPLTTPSVFMAYDMIPEIIGRNLNDPMWIEKHKGINHASGFIAISHNTAKDINKIFPQIPVESITVAHCGVDEKFIPATPEEIRNFKHKYGINKPYFLLGNLGVNGYKNAILFFQAFAQLANKTGFDIVATGAGSQLPNEWRQYTEGCTFHSLYLSDEELRLAYGGAVAFVFPSKYEGFGMPVAEAMACGCPVITTPNASLPEVGGEAVIYVKDDDIESMANALCEVQKPSLRHNLIQAGLQQAQKFSWVTMAEIVKEALFNAISPQIKLTNTNYLIFPDWQSDEETLTEELYNLISHLAKNSPVSDSPLIKGGWGGSNLGGEGIITLVIDRTAISEEDANLILSGIAMNLMMEEEIDLENTLDFALINNLNEQQWNKLLLNITAKITLENENQDIISQLNLEDLVTINGNGNNYAIFPDWKADQEELALEIGQVLVSLSKEENCTLLVNLNNADQEEVGLFFSEIAMNLMLLEGIELSDNLQINFVNFTANQWVSLAGLIKEKITINHEDLPRNLLTQ